MCYNIIWKICILLGYIYCIFLLLVLNQIVFIYKINKKIDSFSLNISIEPSLKTHLLLHVLLKEENPNRSCAETRHAHTHTAGGWSSSSTNGWKLGLGGGTATLRPDRDFRGSWNYIHDIPHVDLSDNSLR